MPTQSPLHDALTFHDSFDPEGAADLRESLRPGALDRPTEFAEPDLGDDMTAPPRESLREFLRGSSRG